MTEAIHIAVRVFLTAALFAPAAPVFAESRPPDTAALVRQGHPVFYDWGGNGPSALNISDDGSIQAVPHSRRGPLGDLMVRYGIMRPRYAVDIYLSDNLSGESSEEIKSVAWEFPKEYYFTEPELVEGTAVKVDAWRPFAVKAVVKYANGDSETFRKWVAIPPTGGQPPTSQRSTQQ